MRGILWIDGVGALAAGIVMLVLRRFFVEVYELPLGLITIIGLANLAYAAVALTLAARKRRRVAWIAALALANLSWALVSALLVLRFHGDATFFGVGHFVLEGAWVATLGTVEWRNRHTLGGVYAV